MIQQVTGCKDCPFVYTKHAVSSCSHQSAKRELITPYLNTYEFGDLYPVWCPLKKEDIVIQLFKNDNT